MSSDFPDVILEVSPCSPSLGLWHTANIQLFGAWGVDVADLPQDGDLGASLSTGQAPWVERLGTSKMWNSGGDLLGSWLWLQGAMAAKLKELQKETGRETFTLLLVYSGTLLWFMRHFSRRRPPGNQLRVVSWHLFVCFFFTCNTL